jgi:hypothetical protein
MPLTAHRRSYTSVVLSLLAALLLWLIGGSRAMGQVLSATGCGIVLAIVPIILSAGILSPIARQNNIELNQSIFGFAWRCFISLGVLLHEISHALMCLAFGHKITRFRPLSFDRETGIAGYVEHTWDRESSYQSMGNLFIGIAPLVAGCAAVYVAALLLLRQRLFVTVSGLSTNLYHPDTAANAMARDLLSFIYGFACSLRFTQIGTYLFIMVLLIVGNSIPLSWADIRNAFRSSLLVVVVFFVVNAVVVTVFPEGAGFFYWYVRVSATATAICCLIIAANGLLYPLLKTVARVFRS